MCCPYYVSHITGPFHRQSTRRMALVLFVWQSINYILGTAQYICTAHEISRVHPGSHKLPLVDTSRTSPVNAAYAAADSAHGPVRVIPLASNTDINGLSRVTASNCKFNHPSNNLCSIRHIPKGARSSYAAALASLLDDVVAKSSAVSMWHGLINFGANILQSPLRGGKRHNLTPTIIKRTNII